LILNYTVEENRWTHLKQEVTNILVVDNPTLHIMGRLATDPGSIRDPALITSFSGTFEVFLQENTFYVYIGLGKFSVYYLQLLVLAFELTLGHVTSSHLFEA
jgi:hypothetical protein